MLRQLQCVQLDYFINHKLIQTIEYEDAVRAKDHLFVPLKCKTFGKIVLRLPKLMNIMDMEDDVLRLPLYTSDTNYSRKMQSLFVELEDRVASDVEAGLLRASIFHHSLLRSNSTNIIYRTGVLELPLQPWTFLYDAAARCRLDSLQKNRAVQVVLHVAGVRISNGIASIALEPLVVYQFEISHQELASDDELDSDADHFSSNISESIAHSAAQNIA